LSIDWQEERWEKTSLQDNVQCGIGNGQCPRYLNAISVKTPAQVQTVAAATKKKFAQCAKIRVLTRHYAGDPHSLVRRAIKYGWWKGLPLAGSKSVIAFIFQGPYEIWHLVYGPL